MKRHLALVTSLSSALALVLLQACSGDDSVTAPDALSDAGSDAHVEDGATQDVVSADVVTTDAAGDAAPTDAGSDACPATWIMAPVVDPSITAPSDGGGVIMHASATGTQDYTCIGDDAGGTPFVWTFVGPEAELKDCHGATVGHHFASDAGATAPEWRTNDGAFVIAKKLAALDAGTGNVPELLLQATANGGAGTLTGAGFVERLNTAAGAAPAAATCNGTVNGTTQKVTYSADYYFFGH